MVPVVRRLVQLLLASGLAVSGTAQSLAEAFRLLPGNTEVVEVRKDPGPTQQRWNRALGRVSGITRDTSDEADLLSEAFPGTAGLPRKPYLVVAGLPGAGNGPEIKAYLLPVANFKAFSRALKASKAQGLLKGTFAAKPYFIAQRGRFAVLAADAATLGRLDGKDGLGRELEPLLPWIQSHDMALVLTAATTRAWFDRTARSLAAAKGMAALAPVLASVQAAVTQVALAADLPEAGGICFHARAWLAPGGALAGDLAPAAGQGHPLAGMSPEGFVFAFGGSMPPAFPRFYRQLLPGILAGSGAAASGAGTEAFLAVQADLTKALWSQAARLALPRHPGAPLLGNAQMRIEVADPAAYLDLLGRASELQEQSGLMTWGHLHSEPDVLPGIPSLSQTFAFGAIKAVDPGPFKLILTLLIGYPDRVVVTYGQVGEHTLLAVLGGADEWKLASADRVTPFGADPAVAATDALLPAGSFFRFYLDLKGLADLGNTFMAFLPAQNARPMLRVPAAPPLALALGADGTGVELSAVATGATLDALGALAQGLPRAKAQPPAAPLASN
jgi:hypothetical protein